jgi:Tol biopolymer transport system component
MLQAALASKTLRLRWPWVAIAALVFTTAAGLGLWLAHSREERPPRVVPLTTFAGSENFPSFSPDGKQVVFTWSGENQNKRDLYVNTIGSATALLATDAAPHLFPAWSPDGRQIAFLKGGERPGIYLISPLGGPEQKIADFNGAGVESTRAGAPAWSPDGKFLVVAKLRHQPKSDPDEGALILVPLQVGEVRALLVPESGRSYQSPAIAPDGRSLAFASCGDSGPRTCALSLVGINPDLLPRGRPRQIREVRAQIAGMAWTADGRSIVYSAGTGVNDYSLWRVDVAGAEPRRLDVASQGAMFPAVALKGNRLTFARFMSNHDIWRLELGGRPEPFLVSSMLDSNAQFSPDGRHIAFASGRSADRVAIWLSDVNGSSLAQLTGGPGTFDGSPQWSPDGRWIAFDALGKDAQQSITVVDSIDGQPRQLTSGPLSGKRPSWSHDGRWIYFSSDRTGRGEIWRIPAEGGEAEQITQDGGSVALESPDGKTLYYTKSSSYWQYPGVPLYARPLGRNEEKQVLDQVAGCGFVVFEDGIYYLGYTGLRTGEIRFQEFATGRSRAVGPIPAPVGLGLSVSPDRKTFLFAEWVAAGTDLMLIENFR